MMNEFVQTIMTRNPITISERGTLEDVKKLFDQNRIHHLPVINDEGDLLGLITTYDLWRLNRSFDDYHQISVVDVMNSKFAKVSSDDKVGTAAELFLDRRFHALPVVDGKKLVGIVTSFDVLRYEFRREYEKPILYQDVLSNG
ncbi:MAG TPA: CBS domain-containing protein [Saprospiraceae bacterium]|nr:CBS domain-containing protein [Saprospiraceae bacterium]HRG64464.1 CBS domain-containing protein [Saprospiraceae bacterium]